MNQTPKEWLIGQVNSLLTVKIPARFFTVRFLIEAHLFKFATRKLYPCLIPQLLGNLIVNRHRLTNKLLYPDYTNYYTLIILLYPYYTN